MLSFAGLALSTLTVSVADSSAYHAHLTPLLHTAILVGHLGGFGLLWIFQFILLDGCSSQTVIAPGCSAREHTPLAIAAIGIDPNHLIRSVGTLGLFAVVFAESGILLGFFLPGDSLLFTAGLFTATTSVLPSLGVLVVGCSMAAIAGDQVGYVLGRRFGPGIFDRPRSGT